MSASRRRRASSSSRIPPRFTNTDAIPLVLHTRDYGRVYGYTVNTVWRKIRDGTIEVPPSGTHPFTWRKADVLADLVQPKLTLQPSGLRRYQR